MQYVLPDAILPVYLGLGLEVHWLVLIHEMWCSVLERGIFLHMECLSVNSSTLLFRIKCRDILCRAARVCLIYINCLICYWNNVYLLNKFNFISKYLNAQINIYLTSSQLFCLRLQPNT